MNGQHRFPWVAVGITAYMAWGSRWWLMVPWGRWALLFVGVYLGMTLARWWRVDETNQSDESMLRRRLAEGKIRLSEYRLLCKELGLQKRYEKKQNSEKEIYTGDGR